MMNLSVYMYMYDVFALQNYGGIKLLLFSQTPEGL